MSPMAETKEEAIELVRFKCSFTGPVECSGNALTEVTVKACAFGLDR